MPPVLGGRFLGETRPHSIGEATYPLGIDVVFQYCSYGNLGRERHNFKNLGRCSMKFQLENEDLIMISGGFIALIQTGFQVTNPLFTLSVVTILKGVFSCFIPGTVETPKPVVKP